MFDIMEIALTEEEATSETTHIEIEPFTILGVVAGLIPYPHHSYSRRGIYQCAAGKQAIGNIAFNQLCRMDNLLNLLVYPQRPLLTTKTIELIGYDKLGAGQNAMVAVTSHEVSGAALVMNKASLDRGFGRSLVMKKYNVVIQKYSNNTSDRILRPDRAADTAGCMMKLDDDGMAAPGEILEPDDIYINKQSPIDTRTPRTRSVANLPDSAHRSNAQSFKGHGGEVVDRVVLCSDKDNNFCIKFIIRDTRMPEIGDKFSHRHGHKGVLGAIVAQEDLPFSEKGICPDLIFNPHNYESEILVSKGFNYGGKDLLYSGTTGCPMQVYIFTGPIYYQKLKHMVLDKMHARGSGPRVMLTRQPTEGRARRGGMYSMWVVRILQP